MVDLVKLVSAPRVVLVRIVTVPSYLEKHTGPQHELNVLIWGSQPSQHELKSGSCCNYLKKRSF